MKLKDTSFSRLGRYSIGIDEDSGKRYISILCRNSYIEYEEYYEIMADEYELFLDDSHKALEFADRCRNRQEDSRLFYQPSIIRGSPV